MRAPAVGLLLLATATWPAAGQSVAGRSPNLRPAWTLGAGQAALRIGHRFEVLSGGDELISIPTLSAAIGLGRRATAGIDFTSNSEVAPGHLGGNEAQFWVAHAPVRRSAFSLEITAGYNTAAQSLDGAVTTAIGTGRLALLAEIRAHQDALGLEQAGIGGTVGAVLALTPRLEIGGDVGGLLSPAGEGAVWSAGLGMIIPGSPHTLSLHATNSGAQTLQGASRSRVIGNGGLRYGFMFSIPLGSARRWASIFRQTTGTEASAPAGADALVDLRNVRLLPAEIRIRAGQTVGWLNHDPLVHTVSAEDGSWDSGNLAPGTSFLRRFDRPGRYRYHCRPHPQMRGVIVVE